MKILLITDTHYWTDISWDIHPSGISTYGNLQDTYQKISEYIETHHIEHLMHLWDISCVKLENKLEKMKEFLDYITCKNIYLLPWNHDIPHLDKWEKKYFWYDKLPQKLSFWDTDIILLWIELQNGLWCINDASFKALEEILSISQTKYKIVCCHYPCSEREENICPYHLLKNKKHKSFLINSSDIRKLLETYSVNTYISGHTHFYYKENIHWVEHITLPAFAEDNSTWKANLSFAILDTENWELTHHTL